MSGGWDEGTGYFVSAKDYNYFLKKNISTNSSTLKHTGQKDKKVVNGTTNYRAHGWTTWVGVISLYQS